MSRGDESEAAALAEAYAHEDAVADAATQTVQAVWPFALVPAGLVLLLLSAVLGDWVWKLALPLFLVGAVAGPLLARLTVRWRSDLPIDLPGHGRIEGWRKKRLVVAAALLLSAVVIWEVWAEGLVQGTVRDALLGWRL